MTEANRWVKEMSARLDKVKKTENGEIDTESFLAALEGHASSVYAVMFGGEGMLSGQLSGDLEHNLTKIRTHYEANKEKYSTIEKMVATEVATYGKDKLLAEKDVAVKGVLWLTRTLNFICTLLEKLANREGKTPGVVAQETYSMTLEPFHGWIGRTTFSSALGWMADTEKLLELFGYASEAEFQADAKEMTAKLRPYIAKNFETLTKNDVNFTYKVM